MQAHLRRAYALSSLGQTEEALLAFCLSTWLNNAEPNLSHPIIPDVAKVLIKPMNRFVRIQTITRFVLQLLHQLLSSTRKSPTFPLATPYTMRRRRKRRHYDRKIVAQSSDCDEENSSCSEETNFTKNRQRRSIERRLKSANTYNVTDSVIIPRPNNRIRGLIDRIHQEIYRIQSKFDILRVDERES